MAAISALPPALRASLSDPRLDEAQFTERCAEAYRLAYPGVRVAVLEPLHLRVETDIGEQFASFQNPWRAAPEARADAAWAQIRAHDATVELAAGRAVGELGEIVPLVRGEIDAAVGFIKAGKSDQVGERLAGDVWVVYAFDKPTVFAPVTDHDLDRLGVARPELRALALANMRARIPAWEGRLSDKLKVLMVRLPNGGGNFEASLLLDDNVCAELAKRLDGDMVAAVPTRDVLLLSGEKSAAGVEWIRREAARSFAAGDHPVSAQLFVRRGGGWERLPEPGLSTWLSSLFRKGPSSGRSSS